MNELDGTILIPLDEHVQEYPESRSAHDHPQGRYAEAILGDEVIIVRVTWDGWMDWAHPMATDESWTARS